MKNAPKSASIKLTEKFDNQLRDILTAELRSVRYTRNKTIDQFTYQVSNGSLAVS